MATCLSFASKGYGPNTRLHKRLGAGIVLATLLAMPVAAQTKILALGDSLTQGYGLENPSDGLVPQLQDWLNAHGADVTVVNGGVSGDTTAGGKSRLDWLLTPDTKAVIVALGGNDLLRGLPPSEARGNLDAILADLQGKHIPALLAGLPAPGNYGPEYQQEFDAIYPDLAQKYGAVLVPNLLAPIMATPLAERAKEDLMQADNIHPTPAGVKKVVAALGPKVLELLAKVKPGS
ncbi:arylesterase [Thioclava sp. 15-R06ZXC-3]|uniref:Arylesterase n=1 Tax=Thioclava arctica TaxID=3238301 RepID=A0ABV3THM5_9RHOB